MSFSIIAQVKRYAKVTGQDYEPIAVNFDAAIQFDYEAIVSPS
ncbi:MAG: hypothetical protein ACK6CP_22155 [Pseudanabaena sp.]|jgi:hypothetical protein